MTQLFKYNLFLIKKIFQGHNMYINHMQFLSSLLMYIIYTNLYFMLNDHVLDHNLLMF